MNDNGGRLERQLDRPLMGGLHAAFSTGGATGALCGGLLAAALAPLAHFAAVAAVLAAASALATRHLASPVVPAATSGRRRGCPSRALFTLLVVGLCATLAEGAIGDWSALYLVDVLGAGSGVGATGYVAFSILMLLGRLVGDHLVRGLGGAATRRLGGAVAATGMAAALLTGHAAVAVAAFGLVGAGLSIVFPVTMSGASHLPAIPPAAGVAAVSMVAYASLLAGPPLIGLLAERATLRAALWLVAACLGAVALLPRVALRARPAAGRGRRGPAPCGHAAPPGPGLTDA
jgi:hypothetical protein